MKVKVTNISVLGKKGSTKSKSTKKGGDTSEASSDMVPFESGLPPIDNIVLEDSPASSARAYSNVRPTANKSKFTAP